MTWILSEKARGGRVHTDVGTRCLFLFLVSEVSDRTVLAFYGKAAQTLHRAHGRSLSMSGKKWDASSTVTTKQSEIRLHIYSAHHLRRKLRCPW